MDGFIKLSDGWIEFFPKDDLRRKPVYFNRKYVVAFTDDDKDYYSIYLALYNQPNLVLVPKKCGTLEELKDVIIGDIEHGIYGRLTESP